MRRDLNAALAGDTKTTQPQDTKVSELSKTFRLDQVRFYRRQLEELYVMFSLNDTQAKKLREGIDSLLRAEIKVLND